MQEINIGDYVKHGDKHKIVCKVSPGYVQVTPRKEEQIKSIEDLKDPEFIKECYWIPLDEIKTIRETINIFK